MAIDGYISFRANTSGLLSVDLSLLDDEAGPADGDLLVYSAFVGSSTGGGAVSLTGPAGWTQLHYWTDSNVAVTVYYAGGAWYKWSDGTETSVAATYGGSVLRVAGLATHWRGLTGDAPATQTTTHNVVGGGGTFSHTPTLPTVGASDYVMAITTTGNATSGDNDASFYLSNWDGRRRGGANVGFEDHFGVAGGELSTPPTAYAYTGNNSAHYTTTMCAFPAPPAGGDFINHRFLDAA